MASDNNKPHSLKVEPWTQFPKQLYSIFSDDFAHDKPLVAKITAMGARSTINIKETISHNSGKYVVSDEAKFWFTLKNDRVFFGKFRSNNYIKLHYDNGVTMINGKKHNFYASVNTNKTLASLIARLGMSQLYENLHSDTSFKIVKQGSFYESLLYSRTMLTHGRFTLGLLGVYNITNRTLQKNNILLKYSPHADHSFFLRAEVEDFRRSSLNPSKLESFFDTVTVDYVGRVNQSTRVAFQAEYNVRKREFNEFALAGQRFLPQSKTLIKGKVNDNFDLAVSFRKPLFKFEDMVTVTASIGANNFTGEDRSFKHGVQLDINI